MKSKSPAWHLRSFAAQPYSANNFINQRSPSVPALLGDLPACFLIPSVKGLCGRPSWLPCFRRALPVSLTSVDSHCLSFLTKLNHSSISSMKSRVVSIMSSLTVSAYNSTLPTSVPSYAVLRTVLVPSCV